jgi:hypothetical protein
MGLFDRIRKSTPTVPLPQLCYDVAYFVLPHLVFNEPATIRDLCQESLAEAGPFFYFMAAARRNVEPQPEDAKGFHWHHGQMSEDREYLVLEYPTPPAVDYSNLPIEQISVGPHMIVLAPYFSAIVSSGGSEEPQYFILGQAPMGGGTTLRCILRNGMNCNLGPGPPPQLPAFLGAVRERTATQV